MKVLLFSFILAFGMNAHASSELKRFTMEIPRLIDHRDLSKEKLTQFLKWRHSVHSGNDRALVSNARLVSLSKTYQELKDYYQTYEPEAWTSNQWFSYAHFLALSVARIQKLVLKTNLKSFQTMRAIDFPKNAALGLDLLIQSKVSLPDRVHRHRFHAELYRFKTEILSRFGNYWNFPSPDFVENFENHDEVIKYLLSIRSRFMDFRKTTDQERVNSLSQYLKESIELGTAFPVDEIELRRLFLFYRMKANGVRQSIEFGRMSKSSKKLSWLVLEKLHLWMAKEWKGLFAWHWITNETLATQSVSRDLLKRKPTREEFLRFQEDTNDRSAEGLRSEIAKAKRWLGEDHDLVRNLELISDQLVQVEASATNAKTRAFRFSESIPVFSTTVQKRQIQSKLFNW